MGIRQLIFLGIVVIISACKSSQVGVKSPFENEIFGIKGVVCRENLDPSAIDSQVGMLTCGDVHLNYDYGKYANRGPLSAEEDFQRSFDTYHHIKFFEDRMIDSKVYKLFLDSVSVIDVRKKKTGDKLMFDCETCNAVSELTFKGDTYYFPLTMSDMQLDDQGAQISFEERGNYRYKYYQRKGESPGLYISPLRNRYRNKSCLSVTVKENGQSNEQMMALLNRVYLK